MVDLELLKKDLIRDEGLRLKVYIDTVGKKTIGVGRNLDDVGINQAEAEFLLENDCQKVLAQLQSSLPWFTSLTEPRQRALANLAFNMGINGLLKFVKALSAMEKGLYDQASQEFLSSKWASQVGARAQRVTELIKKG